MKSLPFLKFLHTTIWIMMAASVFFVFYSGISGNINIFSWIAAGLIMVEGLALIIGKGDCPLYQYTLRITGKTHLNDTYLPEWIFFPHYKKVLTMIFLIGFAMMLVRR